MIKTEASLIFLKLGSSLCFAMTGEIHKFENAGLGYTISKDKVIGASIFTVKADFLRKEMEKIQGHGCSVYLLNQKGEVMLMPEGQEMLWEDIRQNISSLETAENGIRFHSEKRICDQYEVYWLQWLEASFGITGERTDFL